MAADENERAAHPSVTAEEDAAGYVSTEEAHAILSRFNASHWRIHDRERARYSIPANPRYDDDIRLAAFIRQTERERAAADALADACCETVTGQDGHRFCWVCGRMDEHADGCALAAYRAARGER